MAAGSTHTYANLTYNEVKADVDRNRGGATDGSQEALTCPLNGRVQLQEDEEKVLWEIRTPSPPPPAAILVYRPDDGNDHLYDHNDNDVEERSPLVPSGYRKMGFQR